MINLGVIPLLIVGGGLVAVASYATMSSAEKLGNELDPEDYLPMPPPYPPLPRFLIEKKEVVESSLRVTS
jgi:hypothetical protein